jgi:hypothetical protein
MSHLQLIFVRFGDSYSTASLHPFEIHNSLHIMPILGLLGMSWCLVEVRIPVLHDCPSFLKSKNLEGAMGKTLSFFILTQNRVNIIIFHTNQIVCHVSLWTLTITSLACQRSFCWRWVGGWLCLEYQQVTWLSLLLWASKSRSSSKNVDTFYTEPVPSGIPCIHWKGHNNLICMPMLDLLGMSVFGWGRKTSSDMTALVLGSL